MCPGKSFNILPPTEHVTLMKPRGYAGGGKVLEDHVNIPPRVLARDDDPDRVLARLQPGELIIPLPHVKRVTKFLKSQGIKLPRM
jgi:hypothetical protein